MVFKPVPRRPRLEELLTMARTHEMTDAEVRAQSISFVYGQLMDCAPEVTKEQVSAEHDRIYGKASGQLRSAKK